MSAFDRLEHSDKNRQLFHGWREINAPIFGGVAGDEECIVPLYRKRLWQEDMCMEFKLNNRAGPKLKTTYFRENMKPDYKASSDGLLRTKTEHKNFCESCLQLQLKRQAIVQYEFFARVQGGVLGDKVQSAMCLD